MLETATERGKAQGAQFLGFDRALQATLKNNSQERLAAFIAQWEVLITLFKHTFEIPFCAGLMNAHENHRAALAQLMGMGETILSLTKSLDEDGMAGVGYPKSFVESNVNYLRDKYEEHFFSYDAERIEADRVTLWNELSAVNK